MKNPVNRLATAAPRALDSLLGKSTASQDSKDKKKDKRKERTCSFDLDLSGLTLSTNLDSSSSVGGSVGAVGGSIAEEGGSVVSFEELSEMAREFSLDWNPAADAGGMSSSGTPSPN